MRRILFAVAAFLACAVAGATGPTIRWDRIEGVTKDAAGTEVAGIVASSRGVTVGSGKAMFNLETGFVSFEVKGIAYDRHYPETERPIGTYPDGDRMVTLVCDSSGIYGEPVVLDTAAFWVAGGNGSYRGFLPMPVPAVCRDRPDQIVLLLRIPLGPGSLSGVFLAYGAAPSVQ
jgi:hypothetical protein